MTRQEFDEAYNNGYIHGYKAGRSDAEALEDVRLKKIREDIEKQIERDFVFAKTERIKAPVHQGTANGLQVAIKIIDSYYAKGDEE